MTVRDITTIIPNYNGLNEITGCLESILRETKPDRVIVVDDGSTDGSPELVRTSFPDVTLISCPYNKGFAHAVNVGIMAAETPFVFLLNNDARTSPRTLHALLRTLENEGDRAFSVSAKMLTRTEPRKIDNCGDLYCILGWAFSPGRDEDAHAYRWRTRVTSACAGAALYRRDELIHLGLFDEAHFCYLEDVDLGIRARLNGYLNYYEPQAIVLHSGSATSGSRYNEFKTRLTAGNSLYMLYKNFPLPVLVLYAPAFAAGILIKAFFFARKGLGKAYFDGLIEGISKIRNGRDKKLRFRDGDGQVSSLPKLLFEMHINLIRRFSG